jgi:hypothetical protein
VKTDTAPKDQLHLPKVRLTHAQGHLALGWACLTSLRGQLTKRKSQKAPTHLPFDRLALSRRRSPFHGLQLGQLGATSVSGVPQGGWARAVAMALGWEVCGLGQREIARQFSRADAVFSLHHVIVRGILRPVAHRGGRPPPGVSSEHRARSGAR